MKLYDCIVIGGGIVGTAILDRLARYNAAVLLLEKENDVSAGASRANSGIVHAGYDCEPATQKAKFNVRGNALMWPLADELNVPHKKCGSIVVAKKDGYDGIKKLYDKGIRNGVKVEILNREMTLKIEPNIASDIEWSLYAPEAGIISPYQVVIGLADRAILNGAEIAVEAGVKGITKKDGVFQVSTLKGDYFAKAVINAAGANGAMINDCIGAEHFDTEYRRGDYFVLDKTENKNVSTVIFPLPTAAGKGILVAPTADGNVIYGPTSIKVEKGENSVSLEGLDEIRKNVPLSYARPAFNKVIRVYSGVRTIIGHDFIVKKSDIVDNFYMAVGICSPGLSSAPAIAEYLEEMIVKDFDLKAKDNYIVNMPEKKRLSEMSANEINELIKQDAKWGRIVCRCEKVTEAEVVEAIHSPLPATTVDAVKRRVRAGMGRCQGGFCAPRVIEIISRELDIPFDEVKKGFGDSEIAFNAVKEIE